MKAKVPFAGHGRDNHHLENANKANIVGVDSREYVLLELMLFVL